MGPSSGEKSAASMASSFASQITGLASQIFGSDNAVFNTLKSAYQTIVNGGINQQGFSQAELNARNSAAVTNTSAAYRNAAASVKSGVAGFGGGNEPIASGAAISPMIDVANKAAATESGELNQIQQENYATGRQNFLEAAKSEAQLPSEIYSNVPGVASATEGAQKTNLENQQQLNAQSGWWKGPVMGLLNTGLDYATGGLKNVANGMGWNGQQSNSDNG